MAEELGILDFDSLFQLWLSVSTKDIVILSSIAMLQEQILSTDWLTGLELIILSVTINKSAASYLSSIAVREQNLLRV